MFIEYKVLVILLYNIEGYYSPSTSKAKKYKILKSILRSTR